jgi:hypothetical protein
VGRYINSEAVIVRLRGKVKVTSNPEQEPDRLPLLLLNRLINEAEGNVEQDLSTRYEAPFATQSDGPFASLPERPTKEILRTLCELLSVVRVLETDFGRGSGLDGMKYAQNCQDRYDKMLWGDSEKKRPGLLSIRENSYNVFITPPLPGLKSNYQVSQADNGFVGFFGRTDSVDSMGDYALEQINNPGENFWNGHISSDPDTFDGG